MASSHRVSRLGALLSTTLLLLALASGCAGGVQGPYEDPNPEDGNVGKVKGADAEDSPGEDMAVATMEDASGADQGQPDLPQEDLGAPDQPEEPDAPAPCERSWWPDSDQDGAGNSALAPVVACEAPQGYVDNDGDCDDTNAAILPGVDEIAGDGVDQNCDGMELCLVDADQDGWLPLEPEVQPSQGLRCDAPGLALARPVEDGVDCDDHDPGRSPGVTELCDGLDQDCDGLADNGAACPCEVLWREENTDDYDSYLLCNQNLSWNDAAQFCRDVGYEMVTVNHQGENSWLAQTAREMGFTDLWIGLHDQDQEGNFVWASGQEAPFRFWNNNQPNNDGNQDCTEIHANTNHPIATWNDAGCGERQPFWCEAP